MHSTLILRAALSLAMAAAPAAVLAQASKDAGKDSPKPAAQASGPMATVNGVAIPRSRIDVVARRQASRGQPDNEALRNAIREDLINREVISQEATKQGVAKRPDVQTQIDLARQEVIVNAYLDDYLRQNAVSDAEIQKEYDAVKAQTGEREYKARHILVESEDEAKKVIADLKGGAKFEDLAQKLSKDAGNKDRGGDLDWNPPSVFDKVFADAMVKLEKGKTSEAPVRTRFGYHVIRVDDTRKAQPPAFEQVRGELNQFMQRRAIEQMVRDLRAAAKVE